MVFWVRFCCSAWQMQFSCSHRFLPCQCNKKHLNRCHYVWRSHGKQFWWMNVLVQVHRAEREGSINTNIRQEQMVGKTETKRQRNKLETSQTNQRMTIGVQIDRKREREEWNRMKVFCVWSTAIQLSSHFIWSEQIVCNICSKECVRRCASAIQFDIHFNIPNKMPLRREHRKKHQLLIDIIII